MSHADIIRERRGTGFAYRQDGVLITDKDKLAYIKKLAVPPAWQDVHIATSPSEKILASGVDAAGRKQAIYHPEFRAIQEQAKFERILDFAEALPKLRKQIEQDLTQRKLTKEKTLACVVKLMDEAYFRVGNQQYARDNQHYGITTMRSKHANITSTSVTFDFIGKSGQQHHKRVNDRQLARIIKQMDDLPGYEIFKYIDEDGKVQDIDSGDVNEYIKQHMGAGYSAKDFRTWGGTLLATAELAAEERASDEKGRKKIINQVVKHVASRLGNTPAVTRSSYIDPRIIDAYDTSDELAKVRATVEQMRPKKYRKPEERWVLELLKKTT